MEPSSSVAGAAREERFARRRLRFSEISVAPTVHVQTAASRFGSHILEDLKTYVFEGPQSFAMDMDDDDDDDDDEDDGEDMDDDDDSDVDYDDMDGGHTANEADWAIGGDWDDGMGQPQNEPAIDASGPGYDQSHSPQQQQQSFPRVARIRGNLTALSQRFNLYFAVYQDKIYIYLPKKAPQILPSPALILQPRRTKAAKAIGGHLEVVLFAYDDGDVGAYYTHVIARCIQANQEQPRDGLPFHRQVPKEFFHENVGLSAWGLALHEKSRLIGVSTNRHEVVVFAFAMNRRSPQRSESPSVDDSPNLECGLTCLRLEKHLQARTRSWRIVLPLGRDGHNIPSISFCDDEAGYADKIHMLERASALGQKLQADRLVALWYIKEHALNMDAAFRQRHGTNIYVKIHADASQGRNSNFQAELSAEEEDDDMQEVGVEPEGPSEPEAGHDPASKPVDVLPPNRHWLNINKLASGVGCAFDDLSDDVQLARTIVPSMAQTPVLGGNMGKFFDFMNASATRQSLTKPTQFGKTEFPPHMAKNLRRVEPYDLSKNISERASMVLHVPDLNLVVIGSLNGRVALLTLTKTLKNLDCGILVGPGTEVMAVEERSRELSRNEEGGWQIPTLRYIGWSEIFADTEANHSGHNLKKH
ncbi:hypothetical protein B0H63DRAFT_444614 [Podospora didyma]|uniref:Uncharacterized protein n=1 Tax=Podospora didyma TaxID=330526 RepID=A0AAE0P6U8_9PEZI|nr:hypothetical protein B0H63DRAFT_444614 [Podospora didyma]